MSIDTKTSRPTGIILILEFALLFVVTVLARSAFLEHEPIHDELYHLLAAHSWVQNGSFAIADGEYARGSLYTMFVGTVYEYFGYGVTTVRWSSVVVGSLWVLAVFAWCRYRFDRTVAWAAALLFSIAPGAIFLSQYVRFYVLHGLLFWLTAIGIFELFQQNLSPVKRTLLILVMLLCFAAATHLQLTTFVGVAGIALFVAIRESPDLVRRSVTSTALRRMLIGLLIVGVIGVASLGYSGIAAKIFEIYRWAPAWASKGGFLRYHWMLVEQYPLIWATVPVAVLVAVYKKSTAGIYCASIFCAAIVLHSFAGMKAERFIYYVMPFFFILGAILLKETLTFVDRLTVGILDSAIPRQYRVHLPARILVVLLVCTLLLVSNPAHRATADILRGRPVDTGDGKGRYWSRYNANWELAGPELRALAKKSEVVLSTNELHMLYFIGRVDFELSFSRLSELIEGDWHQGEEFTPDFRTGRPVISSAESVGQVVSCFETGLIVVRAETWPKAEFIPDKTKDTIEALSKRLDIPDEWGLRVYSWGPMEVERTPECAHLRGLGTEFSTGMDLR